MAGDQCGPDPRVHPASGPADASGSAVTNTHTGSRLVVEGDLVVKTHRDGTDPVALAARLAAVPRDLALQPVRTDLAAHPPVSWWPRVSLVDPAAPPWFELGALLGRLHRPAPRGLPRHGWPARLVRAVARCRTVTPPVPEWMTLLGDSLVQQVEAMTEDFVLIHGDVHLGQLGRHGGHWLLLDLDDVGVGSPAWDLARPAGFWAAGLLADEAWHAVLDGYRDTGQTDLATVVDPWPLLDLPARVAVYVAAIGALDHGEPTAADLLATCARMAGWEP